MISCHDDENEGLCLITSFILEFESHVYLLALFAQEVKVMFVRELRLLRQLEVMFVC